MGLIKCRNETSSCFTNTFNCHNSKVLALTKEKNLVYVKIKESRLDLFYFYFYFLFIFLFSIFRTTRVRVDWSRCHISHKTDHKTWENMVEDSRTNVIIQHGPHMLTLYFTHGGLG